MTEMTTNNKTDRHAQYQTDLAEANDAFDRLVAIDPDNAAYWNAQRKTVLDDLRDAMQVDLRKRLKVASVRPSCSTCQLRSTQDLQTKPFFAQAPTSPLAGMRYVTVAEGLGITVETDGHPSFRMAAE
jgi:hypothetical protein